MVSEVIIKYEKTYAVFIHNNNIIIFIKRIARIFNSILYYAL